MTDEIDQIKEKEEHIQELEHDLIEQHVAKIKAKRPEATLTADDFFVDLDGKVRSKKFKANEKRITQKESIKGINAQEFKPKIQVKQTVKIPEKPDMSEMMNPETLNIFVNMATSLASQYMKKESLKKEETINFSTALYQVGMLHGWFKNMEFLPYLALTAAAVDMTVTLINKPDKEGSKKAIVNKEIVKEVPQEPKPTEQIIVDVIDQDKLINRINGR